jgi:hypothetical protein
MKEVEQPLPEHGASHQGIVRPANPDTRNLHDLLAERLLRLAELIHRELWKARFFAGRGRCKHRSSDPAASRGQHQRRHKNCGFHDFLRTFLGEHDPEKWEPVFPKKIMLK